MLSDDQRIQRLTPQQRTAEILSACLKHPVAVPQAGEDCYEVTVPTPEGCEALSGLLNEMAFDIFETPLARYFKGHNAVYVNACSVEDPRVLGRIVGRKLKDILRLDIECPEVYQSGCCFRVSASDPDVLKELKLRIHRFCNEKGLPDIVVRAPVAQGLLLNADVLLDNPQVIAVLHRHRENFARSEMEIRLRGIFNLSAKVATDVNCYALPLRMDWKELSKRPRNSKELTPAQALASLDKLTVILQSFAETLDINKGAISHNGHSVFISADMLDARPDFVALMEAHADILRCADKLEGANAAELIASGHAVVAAEEQAARALDERRHDRDLRRSIGGGQASSSQDLSPR